MVQRGVEGVAYVVSDEHVGLVQALGLYFPEAAYQRCQVHYLRTALSYLTTDALRNEVLTGLRDAWAAPSREEAESRRVATDAAIVEAVTDCAPGRVLDVGCGEGWLVRALAASGIGVVGVDGSAPLVEAARAADGGTFLVLPYDELAARPERVGSGFDAIVCNFSLLEEEVVPLLSALRRVAALEGALLIQTVHPWTTRGEAAYRDGWRTETFGGFGERFAEPMPWYFRTLGSWVGVLHAAGWQLQEVREPLHPETGTPLSLLLVCR